MDRKRLGMYYGLANDVCNAYIKDKRLPKKLKDELHSICLEFLVVANKDFKEGKGMQFHTYASNRMRTGMSNYIRSEVRYYTPLRDIQDVDFLIIKEEEEDEEYDFELIDLLEPEDEINKEIYHEILMGTSTYKSIAEKHGISRQAIKKRKRRLVERLKKQLEEIKETEEAKEDKIKGGE